MSKFVRIEYIGRREPYKDAVCGSGVVFIQKGDVQLIPADAAAKMLKHPTVYRLAEAVETVVPEVQESEQQIDLENKAKEAAEKEREDQDTRTSILMMDKEALARFAQTHFRQKLDKRSSVDDMRRQVTGWFEQFGTNP